MQNYALIQLLRLKVHHALINGSAKAYYGKLLTNACLGVTVQFEPRPTVASKPTGLFPTEMVASDIILTTYVFICKHIT